MRGCTTFGWILLLLNCCNSAPKEKPSTVGTEKENVIGSLKWEITETATGKILGGGQQEIQLKEVAFKVGEGTLKQIPLGNHFVLGMVESSPASKTEKKGFGFTMTRDDLEKVFSWEWFIVNYEDHAYKMQEQGSLRIKIAQVGSGWEVTRTEFLSDVSLRASVIGEDLPDKPRWRIKIFKGSFVQWPSLVDGKVVVNN
jgi:hypothetical protein